MKWKQSQRQTVAFLTFCDAERFSKARFLGEALLKPIRDKPQCASNGDERPNRENSGQLAVLQAIQTQPQPSQHSEWGYEYTCNTLRFVIHFLRVAQKLITSLKVLVPGLVLRPRFDLIFTQRLCLITSANNLTCGRNDTVNGERLEYFF
jgi:hypothetical protein